MKADTIYDSPYVTFSQTGQAWTTNAGDETGTHYAEGIVVKTGNASALRLPLMGEHYYTQDKDGEIPVGKWVCAHPNGRCIHNNYPAGNSWCGVNFGRRSCGAKHYSGWVAYCADCGEEITDMLFYMSDQAAASITYLDMGNSMYYYLCPYCDNLEQARSLGKHHCKAISFNQYKVEYDPNVTGGLYGGYMTASFHMYDNEDIYEGEAVTPVTRLTLNSYTRTGMQFTGWNTRPDGSGIAYEDGAEIYNLTTADWKLDNRGTVRLYAQWKASASTLVINPNGGTYEGKAGVTRITQKYLTTYRPLETSVIPPKGYTISFDTHGGEKIAAISAPMVFSEWMMGSVFKGRFYDGEYIFLGEDGSVDTLTANYTGQSVILPVAKREGYSFGGWYYDRDYLKPAGGGGEAWYPSQDTTLHAQWVDLKLIARDNYMANDGKGAVDLKWSQADGKNKVYKIYQSTDSENWALLTSGTDQQTQEGMKLEKQFAYSGSRGTLTVPATGFYTLTAAGAQGADYRGIVGGKNITKTGGKGGRVTARVWLNEGEELTYNVGAQNGYGGGGVGNLYGNGGGYTMVTSNLQGLLLAAGGGGGASPAGNGGAGGLATGIRSDASEMGAGGQAGGGAGYVGGNQGRYEIHEHIEGAYPDGCYRITDCAYEACVNNKGIGTFCYFDQDNGRQTTYLQGKPEYVNWISGRGATMAGSVWKLKAHTWGGPGGMGMILDQIAVNGNKKVDVHILFYCEESQDVDSIVDAQTYALLSDQNNKTLWYGTAKDNTWGGATVKKINNVNNENVSGYEVCVTAIIPADSMDLSLLMHVGHTGGWMNIAVSSIKLSGGEARELVCGYKNGEVLVSRIAYGGSNYVNAEKVYNCVKESGVQNGDGMFAIQAQTVGYMAECNLDEVKAPDLAAPNEIDESKIFRRGLDKGQILVSWDRPADNGTQYFHKVESYLQGGEQVLCTSNMTCNTLMVGVAGYLFWVDRNPYTVVDAGLRSKGAGFTEEESMVVEVKEYTQYLHLATMDGAGNCSDTVHLKLEGEGKLSIAWPLYTDQIYVVEGDNVYAEASKNTYYVRSDGQTPFMLYFTGYMEGAASEQYQPNYSVFESAVSGEVAQTIIYTESDPISDMPIERKASKLAFLGDSEKHLLRYAYTRTKREAYGKKLTVWQQFLLSAQDSGLTIPVTPRVGADLGEEKVYSDVQRDRQNGISLIADGEAPKVFGTDILAKLGQGEVSDTRTVILSATDDLSGLGEFSVRIFNRGNGAEQTYSAEAGTITFMLGNGEAVFEGEYTIQIEAIDHVGNRVTETYKGEQFGLTAQIERILEPHAPLFKRGESGLLKIRTYGYADRVEVVFPDAMTELDPSLNRVYDYGDDRQYEREETLQFMVPLYLPDVPEYVISVRAYKDGRLLEEHPVLGLLPEEGSVLNELRTRLR